ncbi:hypothetical protein BJX64DRAFT_247193 [Aspergillus heterothallicus]
MTAAFRFGRIHYHVEQSYLVRIKEGDDDIHRSRANHLNSSGSLPKLSPLVLDHSGVSSFRLS